MLYLNNIKKKPNHIHLSWPKIETYYTMVEHINSTYISHNNGSLCSLNYILAEGDYSIKANALQSVFGKCNITMSIRFMCGKDIGPYDRDLNRSPPQLLFGGCRCGASSSSG